MQTQLNGSQDPGDLSTMTEKEPGKAFAVTGTAFFLFLVHGMLLIALAYVHTVWRDESNVLLMARDSRSLRQMFYPMHYDGHPPLWYLLNYLVARITEDPLGMKLLTLALSIALSASIFLSGRLALWKRTGIAFSYLFLFEYGTIERNYLPGLLALVVAVQMLLSRHSRVRFHAVWLLCLAALASSPTLALATVTMALWWMRENLASDDVTRWRRPVRLPEFAGILVFFAAVGVAAFVIHPPPDSNLFADNPAMRVSVLSRIVRCGAHATRAFFAVPPPRVRFWDATVWNSTWPALHYLSVPLGWLILVASLLYFRRPVARWYFGAGGALIVLLLVGSGRSFERHVGFLFVAFVLALLVEEQRSEPDAYRRMHKDWRGTALTFVLAAQVYGGLFAVAISMRHPFSASRQAAEFLQSKGLADVPMLIVPSEIGTSVLAYLHRKNAESMEYGRPTSFIVWNSAEMNHRLPDRVDLGRMAHGREKPLLMTGAALTSAEESRMGVHLLATFDDSICSYDSYYIYR